MTGREAGRQPGLAPCLSARSPTPDLRALVPESGVGQSLQRVVQVAELVRDHRQLLAGLLTAVQPGQLLDESVEALQQRLELAVPDRMLVHSHESSAARAATDRTTCVPGPKRSSSRASEPGPASSASIRRLTPK